MIEEDKKDSVNDPWIIHVNFKINMNAVYRFLFTISIIFALIGCILLPIGRYATNIEQVIEQIGYEEIYQHSFYNATSGQFEDEYIRKPIYKTYFPVNQCLTFIAGLAFVAPLAIFLGGHLVVLAGVCVILLIGGIFYGLIELGGLLSRQWTEIFDIPDDTEKEVE